jgi:hypothetical protein
LEWSGEEITPENSRSQNVPGPEEGAGYIRFDALLDVRGVTEQGVVLDGRC